MDSHSRVTQAERTVGALRFFLYIRFFLNAPLDLLLDPLTLSGSLVLHFTVVGPSESLLCFNLPPFTFKIVRRLPPTLRPSSANASTDGVSDGLVTAFPSKRTRGASHTPATATIDKRRRATPANVGSGEYLSAEMARGVIVRAFGLFRLGAPSAAFESPLAPSAGPLCRLWPRPLASQASFQPLVAFGRPGSPRVAPLRRTPDDGNVARV